MSVEQPIPVVPWMLDRRAEPPDDGEDRPSVPDSVETPRYERVVDSNCRDSRYRLLVPVFSENAPEDLTQLIRTARAIVRDREGDLLFLSLVVVPEQTPYESFASDESLMQDRYETTERLLRMTSTQDVSTSGVVCLTRKEASAVLDIADRYECDGIVMDHSGERSQRRRLLARSAIERITARAECEVFVEKPATEETPPESILLAVSGGPHSGLAAETARALALDSGACVDAVHFLSESASGDERDGAEEVVEATTGVLSGIDRTSAELVTAERPAEAIVSRSDEHDITVLGAPTAGLLKQFVFGTVPDTVSRRSENAVLMVKRGTGDSVYGRWIAGDSSDVPRDDHRYVCRKCGERFENQRQVCPECGGYDIQREWREEL